jgi:hypothetical protein
VYQVDERDHMVDRCVWENPVPEVENMTGTALRLVEHPARLPHEFIARRKQDDGVEIPLNRYTVPQPPASRIERDPPVDSNDVSSRVALKFEKRAGVSPEMNHRYLW